MFWDRNFFAGAVPMLETLASSPFVRGAVSGIGTITVAAGLAELFGALGSRRRARSGPRQNAEV